jgi:hypothetical protein
VHTYFLIHGTIYQNNFFVLRPNGTHTYIDIYIVVASPLRSTWHIKNMCYLDLRGVWFPEFILNPVASDV